MFRFFIICIRPTNEHVFNIKALSTIEHIIENNNVIRYYKSPTLDQLRQNKIKETNILNRLMHYREKRSIRTVQIYSNLYKKRLFLQKILQIRAKLYQEQMKSQIFSGEL